MDQLVKLLKTAESDAGDDEADDDYDSACRRELRGIATKQSERNELEKELLEFAKRYKLLKMKESLDLTEDEHAYLCQPQRYEQHEFLNHLIARYSPFAEDNDEYLKEQIAACLRSELLTQFIATSAVEEEKIDRYNADL